MRDLNRRAFLGIGGSLLIAGAVSAKSNNSSRTGSANSAVGLKQIGRYESGLYDEGGAEIPAHDPITQRLFVVNADLGGLDVIDISDPKNPTQDGTIDDLGGTVNSVDVFEGCVAVAVEGDDVDDTGEVVFFDSTDDFTDDVQVEKNRVEVGVLPDMVTFTPDGTYVLTANEAEPDDDFDPDPEGSISIVDLSTGVENATVTDAGFTEFNSGGSKSLDEDVRIYGPGSTVAEDLEPEYIAVSSDSKWAYATLQENNALAIVDIENMVVEDVVPLGFKNHSLADNGFGESNALDAVDDGAIGIENQPLLGMYQPDSIESIEIDGMDYLVTANEGDAREYEKLFEVGILTETDGGFVLEIDDDGESETEDVPIAEGAYSQSKLEKLEGLEATVVNGLNSDGEIERLYVFGGRSYAIWKAAGAEVELVYESGDRLEQITADALPDDFNSDDDSIDDLDGESTASGPEPEGVAVGYVDETPVAFVGLEEVGGIAMFDISDPTDPEFVEYVNNRIFDPKKLGLDEDADLGDALEDGVIEPGAAGDLAPEGLLFIRAADSPASNGRPLLVVGNEVSGTTTLYEVTLNGSGNGNRNGNAA